MLELHGGFQHFSLYTVLICTVSNIVFNISIISSSPPTSHSRDWRYHKEDKIWITRAPGEWER